MKLVNTKTHETLVEFQCQKTVFYNRFLEREMETLGIIIPHGLRGVFGKECVKLGEDQFQEAFKEVYYLTYMDRDHFHWEEEK